MAINADYDDLPTGQLSIANQRQIWGEEANRNPDLFQIVSAGAGNKALRGITTPNNESPQAVFTDITSSETYFAETRFRLSPNFDEDKGAGTKIMLGFSGGDYNRGRKSHADSAEQGTGGAVLTTVNKDGRVRDYMWDMNIDNGTGDINWTKSSFDANWHTMRYYAELNTPGRADGVYRVWFDDNMVFEDLNVQWRSRGEDWAWDHVRFLHFSNFRPSDTIYVDYDYHRLWSPDNATASRSGTSEKTTTSVDRSSSADSLRLEAEDATRAGSVEFASKYSGHTGRGYIDFGFNSNDSVTFDVRVDEAGRYDLDFRYAQRGNAKDADLLVDGDLVETLAFASTRSWSNWAVESTGVVLTAGSHTITLDAPGAAGVPNIDHLEIAGDGDIMIGNRTTTSNAQSTTTSVDRSSSADSLRLEAEDATRAGSVEFASKYSGHTGRGYIDFGFNSNDSVTFDVRVDEAGRYDLDFRYAQRGNAKDADLLVDGDLVETLAFASTRSWSNWAVESTGVVLTAGSHTITLDAPGAAGVPNIDHLEIAGDGDIMIG